MSKYEMTLMKLISLIHQEAQRAYWSSRMVGDSHCGNIYGVKCKKGCPHDIHCKEADKIDELIRYINEGE